jgi:hypothetical protein
MIFIGIYLRSSAVPTFFVFPWRSWRPWRFIFLISHLKMATQRISVRVDTFQIFDNLILPQVAFAPTSRLGGRETIGAPPAISSNASQLLEPTNKPL